MSRHRRALIIGGSLAGLFAGLLLRNRGWDVQICERTDTQLASRGAGIVTHPELFETLTRCGATVDETIGVEVPGRRTFDPSGTQAGELRFPQVMTSWGRLYALLKEPFPADAYHFGFALERVEQGNDKVVACFADGQQLEADILVAADGIRSTVRSQLLPDLTPQYAGYVAWRGMVDEAAVSNSTHAQLFDWFCFCLPRGEQMLGYPVAGAGNSTQPGKRRYNFVWYRPADEHGVLPDLLADESGHRHEFAIAPPLIRSDVVARMRRDAEVLLAPQFAEIVHLTPQPFFQPIYDLEAPRLVFGRVVLIGDAAFVARPHVGMGVSKAAQDAVSLVEALDTDEPIDAALSRYEKARIQAGAKIVMRARQLGAYMQAQLKTPVEREMAEHFRTPAVVMQETATPEAMWSQL